LNLVWLKMSALFAPPYRQRNPTINKQDLRFALSRSRLWRRREKAMQLKLHNRHGSERLSFCVFALVNGYNMGTRYIPMPEVFTLSAIIYCIFFSP